MIYEIIDVQTNKVVNRIVYDGSKGIYTAPEGCILQEATSLNIGQDVVLDNGVYKAIVEDEELPK